jgi:hypothetical protein
MLYDVIDGFSSMIRRTAGAYGQWIKSRYVDPRWGKVMYD